MLQYIVGKKLINLNEIDGYKLITKTSWLVILDILVYGKISYNYSLLNQCNTVDNIIRYINKSVDRVTIATFFMLELISFYDPESSISMVTKRNIFSKMYDKVKFKPMWLIRLWTKLIYNRGIEIVSLENETKYYFNYNFGK